MARKPREKSCTGIYHVMLRGVNKQIIFDDTNDYHRVLRAMRLIAWPEDELGKPQPPLCTVYAYCLMSNHVHLLIREATESLPEIVKRPAVTYAQYYNKKYEHSGHLFQNRFRSEPVNDEGYFLTLMRYIHQNPVAAGITRTVDEYEWSSWHEYELAGRHPQPICNVRPVLARMPLDELRALVFEPLSKTAAILDFDTKLPATVRSSGKTDDEVVAFLCGNYGLRHPTDLQLYSRDRRDDILRAAKQFGATIRQLSRLTGITFSRVRTA